MRHNAPMGLWLLFALTPTVSRAQDLPPRPRSAQDSLAADLGSCAAYQDALSTLSKADASARKIETDLKQRFATAGLSLPNREYFLSQFRFSIYLIGQLRLHPREPGEEFFAAVLRDAYGATCATLLLLLDERLHRVGLPSP